MSQSHYIAPFTESNGRKQRAACGAWVMEAEHSFEPTCRECREYLGAEPQTPEETERRAKELFGE